MAYLVVPGEPDRRLFSPPSRHAVAADDRLSAAAALRMVSSGVALLWRGDYPAARRLLDALARRLPSPPPDDFARYRAARAHRARLLSLLYIPLDPGYLVPLRRAPDVRAACTDVYGPSDVPAAVPLRELLGVLSAAEWRRTGIAVPALGARIHPHYGVFAPLRPEYVELVARAPLPSAELAFDIGTGTGVLAAVLAHRGVARVVATNASARAVACARENLTRLGFGDRAEVVRTDLFPPGRAPLVVTNPPWLPGRPRTPLDHAVYDPGHRMLRGFLDRARRHLTPDGEAWLVLSDLAEHLGLRTRAQLLEWIEAAGLRVVDRTGTPARHPRALDPADPLHRARAAEVTSLWRLSPRP
ncbi:methylase of polypeptide subunit release factors [Amycolatopsis lexingtonensis]|uniref:Methylase of polypeptide subunit release factors n=1 Tax=Amycolatopsis lexingtonensis TaxID=218822 RepID=A0ABR9I4Z2_9PSEU|nr:class I SAM-dependent methyltransferase [Amycolatopsis lexingtonensis]MBE1498261.1 methylase of polypeptide subunit release factors [Amycolatopsis lexingtonensis]